MLMQNFLFAEKKNYQEKQNYFSFRQMPSSIKNPNKPYLCYIQLG